MSAPTAKPLDALIQMPRAATFVQWLVDHWRDEGIAVEQPTPERVLLSLAGVGHVELQIVATRQLSVVLQPATPRMGELMQLSLAEHLGEFADEMRWPDGSWELAWSDDAPRSSAQLQLLQVRANHAITPRMRRLRLQGEGVRALADGGLHVRMLLPQSGQAPAWPTVQSDGRLQWPPGQPRLPRRTYTIRAIDLAQRWIDVDVLLHPDAEGQATSAAPGSTWAAQAQPGSEVGVLSPAGGLLLNAARVVLVADACALPAAARMLQAASAGASLDVLLWVADEAEQAALDVAPASAQVDWICAGEPGASPPEIARVLQWLGEQPWQDAEADTVLWVAGGLPLTQAVRRWTAEQAALRGVRTMIHTYWR